MSGCSFCDKFCGNPHCPFGEKMTLGENFRTRFKEKNKDLVENMKREFTELLEKKLDENVDTIYITSEGLSYGGYSDMNFPRGLSKSQKETFLKFLIDEKFSCEYFGSTEAGRYIMQDNSIDYNKIDNVVGTVVYLNKEPND